MLRVHNQIQTCSDASEKNLSDLVTPICAAGVVCLLLKEGVVCGALHRREQDDHTHYDQKDLRVLYHRTGSVAVLGKNTWEAWPLIIFKASTAKQNYYRTN